jgi:hypothetical protein
VWGWGRTTDGQAQDSGIAKLAAQIGALYDDAYDAARGDRERGPHDDVRHQVQIHRERQCVCVCVCVCV